MRTKKARIEKYEDEACLIRSEELSVVHVPAVVTSVKSEDMTSNVVSNVAEEVSLDVSNRVGTEENGIVSSHSNSESVETKAKRYKSDWNESSGIFSSVRFGEENVADVSVDNTEDTDNLFIIERNGSTSSVGVSFENNDYVPLDFENVVAEYDEKNEVISNGGNESCNSNRNGIVVVESIENFKQLSSRYDKFCYSLGIDLQTDVPAYKFGPEEEETEQRAKLVVLNEVRNMIECYKSKREFQITKSFNNIICDAMTTEVAQLTSDCNSMKGKLYKFVDTLTECASLDFGFCVLDDNKNKMCFCPFSESTKRFRNMFLIDTEGHVCKNKKAMTPIAICAHLQSVGKQEGGFSLIKAMHMASYYYLQKKFPENFKTESGNYGIKKKEDNITVC
jgi:hypothetical protein